MSLCHISHWSNKFLVQVRKLQGQGDRKWEIIYRLGH